jgi:hypothetical protein
VTTIGSGIGKVFRRGFDSDERHGRVFNAPDSASSANFPIGIRKYEEESLFDCVDLYRHRAGG